MIKDLDPGDGDASISEFAELGGLLYFEADNDLWVTDGTEAGTNLVMTVSSQGIERVRSLVAWQEQLYFEADQGTTGRELYRFFTPQLRPTVSGQPGRPGGFSHR